MMRVVPSEPAIADRYSYVRPVGLLPQDRGLGACDHSMEFERLAGGPFVFTQVELVRRDVQPGGISTSRIVPVGGSIGFDTQDWHHPPFVGGRLWDQFERVSGERPVIAGLSMDRPRIMGIVNLTPDSFSDGGRLASADAAVEHGLRLVAEGADILDLGAESTRPGSDPVSLDEELARLMPVLKRLRATTSVAISIDTRKAEVMRQAAVEGANIVNDVSALTYDVDALATVAKTGLPVILMHAQGDPKTMQAAPHYDDVVLDVFDHLEARIGACFAAGIPMNRIVVDPGIGFGKTFEHNLTLMSRLGLFHSLGVPLMLGASRKSFIGRITGETVAANRVCGSIGAALAAAAQGVQIIRVHDVAATRQALDTWWASTMGQVPARKDM